MTLAQRQVQVSLYFDATYLRHPFWHRNRCPERVLFLWQINFVSLFTWCCKMNCVGKSKLWTFFILIVFVMAILIGGTTYKFRCNTHICFLSSEDFTNMRYRTNHSRKDFIDVKYYDWGLDRRKHIQFSLEQGVMFVKCLCVTPPSNLLRAGSHFSTEHPSARN
jgi:hypothetical protein